MIKLMERLQDWYTLSIKDNLIAFLNETSYHHLPRDIEGVRTAEIRKDERKYKAMRKRFDAVSGRYLSQVGAV